MTDVATVQSQAPASAKMPPLMPFPKLVQSVAFVGFRRWTLQKAIKRYGPVFTINVPFFGRTVVVADWLLTTPAAIFQPVSGLWLVHIMGLPLATPWVAWSLGLYVLAIACWLPVVWIQLRLRDHAAAALASGGELHENYWWLFRGWVVLGFVAFFAFLAIFWLMVAKRAPFS
jgi:uncharacterized membrane protein